MKVWFWMERLIGDDGITHSNVVYRSYDDCAHDVTERIYDRGWNWRIGFQTAKGVRFDLFDGGRSSIGSIFVFSLEIV